LCREIKLVSSRDRATRAKAVGYPHAAVAFFIAKAIFYFAIFGGFWSDLPYFTGLVGLSICLNGGVAEPVAAPQAKMVYNRFKLPPALRKPVGV
jgi:hypothetical protein